MGGSKSPPPPPPPPAPPQPVVDLRQQADLYNQQQQLAYDNSLRLSQAQQTMSYDQAARLQQLQQEAADRQSASYMAQQQAMQQQAMQFAQEQQQRAQENALQAAQQNQTLAMNGARDLGALQYDYNTRTLRQNQAANMINQSGPVGSMNYVQSGTDAAGNPRYTLQAKLSAPQQKLYDTTVSTKGLAGTQANNLMRSAAPMYSDANTMMNNIFTGADSLTSQRVNAALGFQQQFLDQDRSNLDNSLRSQGLQPGMPGYDRAMNKLKTTQYGNQQNYIASVMPQSMATAKDMYMTPLQTAQALMPMGVNDNIQQYNTPQFNMQNTDLTGSYTAGLGNAANTYGAILNNNNSTTTNALNNNAGVFNNAVNATNNAYSSTLGTMPANFSNNMNPLVSNNNAALAAQTGTYGTYANAINQGYANQMQAYNARMQNQSAMMNGIFGLAGAGLRLI